MTMMASDYKLQTERSFDFRDAGSVKEVVREYFSKNTLEGQAIEASWRCQDEGSQPVRRALAAIGREERISRCGCGLPFPELLSGARVLDIGCGTGFDSLVLSQLVGNTGSVLGIDLCPDLVNTASRFARQRASNDRLKFVCGDVASLGEYAKVISQAPFSVAVANCAFSLMADKVESLAQISRFLSTGGELYVCDVFVSHDVTSCMRNNAFAWTKCIGGAWRFEEFCSTLSANGFSRPRLISSRPLTICEDLMREIAKAFGLGDMTKDLRSLEEMSGFRLCAATYRAFKLPGNLISGLQLEVETSKRVRVTFTPPADSEERELVWDKQLTFHASKPLVVSSHVASMLECSRYSQHFLTSRDVSVTERISQEAHPNPFEPPTNSQARQVTKTVNSSSTSSGLRSNSPLLTRCGPAGMCRRGVSASIPLTGLVRLNGAASSELSALLQSSPGLSNLRDMVAKQGIRGCGNGSGCD